MRLLIIIGLTTLALNAAAKDKPYSFFMNMGTDYQLNKGDVTNNTYNTNALSMNNSMSGRIGLEFRRKILPWLFISAGTDYRMITHKLNINYEADKAGFASTNATYSEEVSFTSHNIDPYIKFGYSFAVSNKSRIDFSFGTIFSIPVNAERNEGELITLNVTDKDNHNLVMYRTSSWGNDTYTYGNDLPLKSLYTMQLAYRLIPEKHTALKWKIGIDFSGSVAGKMNRMGINYFGNNRSDAGKSVFADRFQSLGLFIGVGL